MAEVPHNSEPERAAAAEEARSTGSHGLEPELLLQELEQTRHDPYAALRLANYRAFAGGFVLSSTGLQMLSTALGWEIWMRTQDPLALGIVGLARAVPVILLALPAGQLVDIYNRKKLLVGTQASYALLAAGFAAASFWESPVWVLYLLTVLTGCTRVVNGPTRQSILPLIVPAGVFHSAVTWNSGVFQFSATVGPLLAGALLAASRTAWPVYVLAAAGCLAFAVSAILIRFKHNRPQESRFSIGSLFAGFGHLRREKTILATITLDLLAVLFGGATALLPIYAEDILKVGPGGLGILRAAPFVGALIMALVLAHTPPFKRAGRALLWSVAGFGVAMIIFGLSRWFWLSVAMLALSGALDNISVVIRHVLVQMRTPDHLRGRVSAVNSVFIESSNELGAFESGLVARLFGVTFSVVSGGVGTILTVLAVGWKWPQIRRLGRLNELSR